MQDDLEVGDVWEEAAVAAGKPGVMLSDAVAYQEPADGKLK